MGCFSQKAMRVPSPTSPAPNRPTPRPGHPGALVRGPGRFGHLLGVLGGTAAKAPPGQAAAPRGPMPPADGSEGPSMAQGFDRHVRARSPLDSASEAREAEGWVGLPPAALLPPAGPHAPPPAAGSPGAHAEVAAMAERLLSSLRVGAVGRHGREVRMCLRGPFEGVEVRLRQADGQLTAELHAPPRARARAMRLAERLGPALASQGAGPCALQVC
jgi:hypothetical protein